VGLTAAMLLLSLTDVGFGTIEIRGRRPRILDPENYPTDEITSLLKASKFVQ
jgi:hypothetical protein